MDKKEEELIKSDMQVQDLWKHDEKDKFSPQYTILKQRNSQMWNKVPEKDYEIDY